MAKIYTKGGDKGETSLVGGQRVLKSSRPIDVYGTVDELNSIVGMARVIAAAQAQTASIDGELETIQHWLFDLGSLLACLPSDRAKYKLRPLTPAHVTWLENKIDLATSELQPLTNFILPAGSELAVRLHVARTVARRVERLLLDPQVVTAGLPDEAVPFINRLSDYFFVCARLANKRLGVGDVLWALKQP